MKKLKGLILWVLMVGAVGIVSACGASDDGAGQTNGNVTLEFWFQGTGQAELEFHQRAIASFNEIHPDITINATGLPATISDQETMLNAAVLAGTYPDVIAIVLAQVGSRGVLGDFENLDRFIAGWDGRDDLFASAYEMGQFAGNQISLGLFPNPQLYVFRVDRFLEVGLDPNNPPSTWSELRHAAELLTERDNNNWVTFAGFDVPNLDSSLVFTEPFMRSAGSLIIDEINQVPSFLDPGAIAAMNFIGELAEMNISIPHDQQNPTQRPFMNGMAAISNLSVGMINNFRTNNPEIEIGFLPVISQDGSRPGVAFSGYQLITMSSASNHKDETWLFIEHMLSQETVWDRTETFHVPIVRYSLQDRFLNWGDPVLNAAVLDYVANGHGKNTVPWISVFNMYMSLAFEEVINGAKTAEQALQDAYEALIRSIG